MKAHSIRGRLLYREKLLDFKEPLYALFFRKDPKLRVLERFWVKGFAFADVLGEEGVERTAFLGTRLRQIAVNLGLCIPGPEANKHGTLGDETVIADAIERLFGGKIRHSGVRYRGGQNFPDELVKSFRNNRRGHLLKVPSAHRDPAPAP